MPGEFVVQKKAMGRALRLVSVPKSGAEKIFKVSVCVDWLTSNRNTLLPLSPTSNSLLSGEKARAQTKYRKGKRKRSRRVDASHTCTLTAPVANNRPSGENAARTTWLLCDSSEAISSVWQRS